MSSPPRTLAASLAAFATTMLAAGAARADVFSPGELARAHQGLEGLAQCTKCHVAGEQLSGARCLECHGELRERIAGGRGWHGRLPAAERNACETCHHEHQGRDVPLVDWGKDGRKGFDHARAGFELRGKHRGADCARCHDRRLVQDPGVLDLLAKQPSRVTYLGAPTACATCHFDEHRGQLGADCRSCHSEEAWKPARGFRHARTAYPLVGKHARVPCARCHAPEPDGSARAPAPAQTAPVNAAAFVRFKGRPFQACTDCHRDPHQGRFGGSCTGCHTPADWRKLTGAGAQRAFHEKTRYPLRGGHADARCEACHGPFPGVKARFKGIPFERCTDCHADAHLGQLASLAPARPPAARTAGRAAPAPPTCDACHGVDGWIPARFEADDHARLAYKLEGAHRAVACLLCHPRDPRLEARIPSPLRAELARRKRPLRVSLALLDVPKANDCRTCHRDPHAGQFEPRAKEQGCATCHGIDSFRRPRFDHARDSRFPLEGKHAQTACGSCHRPDAEGVVRYRPLPLTCAGCHADPHARQFAAKGGAASDCARCHGAAAWKDLRFRHEPPFTAFPLDGKHRRVECASCHAPVRIAGGDVRRYRPLPTDCEGCHADPHRGSFRAFAPAQVAQPLTARTAPVAPARADLSVRGKVPAGGATRCAACHTAEDWRGGAFAHERTGFPLEGAHVAAECSACHGQGTLSRAVPRACAGCHGDVHQGRLGGRCEKCHEATAWRDVTFDADAHRRGAFPLTGRHAFTPCDSCHGDRRDRGFTRPLKQCVACHEADWARATSPAASVDHVLAGFPQTCQACHTAWRFSPAAFPAHDACFQLTPGPHAGVRCRDCHTSVPVAAPPFTCQTDTADCIRCHQCNEHDPVAGFACTNRKCYECHAFATVGGVR